MGIFVAPQRYLFFGMNGMKKLIVLLFTSLCYSHNRFECIGINPISLLFPLFWEGIMVLAPFYLNLIFIFIY